MNSACGFPSAQVSHIRQASQYETPWEADIRPRWLHQQKPNLGLVVDARGRLRSEQAGVSPAAGATSCSTFDISLSFPGQTKARHFLPIAFALSPLFFLAALHLCNRCPLPGEHGVITEYCVHDTTVLFHLVNTVPLLYCA